MIIRYGLGKYIGMYGLPAWAGNNSCTVNWEGGPTFTVASRNRVRAHWIHRGGKG